MGSRVRPPGTLIGTLMRVFAAFFIVASMTLAGWAPSISPVAAGEPDIREGGQAWAKAKTGPEFVPNEIVVRFRPGVPPQAIEAINRSHGAATVKVGARSGLHRIRLPQGANLDAVLAAYRARPEVAVASRNAVAHAFDGPNDTYYRLQWHLYNARWGGIQWQAVWERPDQPKGAGVPVAVIDTGVAWDNPNALDLQGQSFL